MWMSPRFDRQPRAVPPRAWWGVVLSAMLCWALVLAPLAARMHQVVHAGPLAHAHAAAADSATAARWVPASQSGQVLGALADHEPGSVICIWLDQWAHGDGAQPASALWLPPALAPVALVLHWQTPALPDATTPFQARAPPAANA